MPKGVYERKPRPCPTRDRLLRYLIRFREDNGYGPTVREMAAAIGVRSTCTVFHHLACLEDDGLIIHTEGKCRDFAATTNDPPMHALPAPATA